MIQHQRSHSRFARDVQRFAGRRVYWCAPLVRAEKRGVVDQQIGALHESRHRSASRRRVREHDVLERVPSSRSRPCDFASRSISSGRERREFRLQPAPRFDHAITHRRFRRDVRHRKRLEGARAVQRVALTAGDRHPSDGEADAAPHVGNQLRGRLQRQSNRLGYTTVQAFSVRALAESPRAGQAGQVPARDRMAVGDGDDGRRVRPSSQAPAPGLRRRRRSGATADARSSSSRARGCKPLQRVSHELTLPVAGESTQRDEALLTTSSSGVARLNGRIVEWLFVPARSLGGQ